MSNETKKAAGAASGARVRPLVHILSVNPNGGWKREPDTIERILRYLDAYALDPVFEDYGNFVDASPEWLNPETARKYAGCTRFWGNFYAVSGVFDVITNDGEIIERLTAAIRRNQRSAAYASAKAEIEGRAE